MNKNEALDGECERDVHGTREEDVDASSDIQVSIASERGESAMHARVHVLLNELPNLLDADHADGAEIAERQHGQVRVRTLVELRLEQHDQIEYVEADADDDDHVADHVDRLDYVGEFRTFAHDKINVGAVELVVEKEEIVLVGRVNVVVVVVVTGGMSTATVVMTRADRLMMIVGRRRACHLVRFLEEIRRNVELTRDVLGRELTHLLHVGYLRRLQDHVEKELAHSRHGRCDGAATRTTRCCHWRR